jgi:hypothetical protein
MNDLEYCSEEQVINALRSQLGNKGLAAAELGTTRGKLNDYLMQHPAVREELQSIKEAIKDDMESELIKRSRLSDTLLMFYIKTQMRDRGYGQTTEITGPNGGPVQMDARALIAALREGVEGVNGITAEDEDEQLRHLLDGGNG